MVLSSSYETMGDTEFETYSFSGAGAFTANQYGQTGGRLLGRSVYLQRRGRSVDRVILSGHLNFLCAGRSCFIVLQKPDEYSTAILLLPDSQLIWILYRHYPFWQRSVRVGLLSAVCGSKVKRAGYLKSCLQGILDDFEELNAIGQFNFEADRRADSKLSTLNRRWRVRVEGRTIRFRERTGASRRCQ
ncbi:MAG: hypothetical protein U0936_03225 [Planctomycetaceae bacterium]